MHFFEHYNENIVKYDLINKFRYKNLTKIPKLNFISLRFNFKKSDLKQLIAALIALELITFQKGSLIESKVSSVSLKIREGQPVGCKVVLRRLKMLEFLTKLINKIVIENKKIKRSKIFNYNSFSFKISNVLIFNELEKNYQFFKNLKGLDINISTTPTDFKNFLFLLKSHKIKV
jgi:large subunit ribosomal protein L5|tara:strand:- start:138 stop:662 length:525 start_codon:yes stop_codon:yes gene_type:complete